MTAHGKQDRLRLGFLTAIEVADKGFVGGLLVTNHCGRPLEFQCTVPVRPNSTQEILYGPTLIPFLLGELSGEECSAVADIQRTGLSCSDGSTPAERAAVDIFASGMNGALHRRPKVRCLNLPVAVSGIEAMQWHPYWPRVKTICLTFPAG